MIEQSPRQAGSADSEHRCADSPIFEALLSPNRSLSPRGFAILGWIMALIGAVHGAAFLIIGAWPVVGFAGAEWLLFWWLFRKHFKGDHRSERLRLYPDRLIVEYRDAKGRVSATDWQPYWLRIDLDESPAMGNSLHLASHGRRVEIGRFLSADERLTLARRLRVELMRCRRTGV